MYNNIVSMWYTLSNHNTILLCDQHSVVIGWCGLCDQHCVVIGWCGSCAQHSVVIGWCGLWGCVQQRSTTKSDGRFLSIFVGFCRILSDFVGFCRILSDFVGFCRFLSVFVGLCRILSDYVGDRCCIQPTILGSTRHIIIINNYY